MAAIRIDADALFRAVTAYEYKLLAYYLDMRSGEVVARTLTPGEVHEPPPGPSVPPLPVLGGDLHERKGQTPFGPPPVAKKLDLFKDSAPQPQKSFGGDFWKHAGHQRVNPFGSEGYKRESAVKKLAEIFGEAPPEQRPGAPAGQPAPSAAAGSSPTPPTQPAAPTHLAPQPHGAKPQPHSAPAAAVHAAPSPEATPAPADAGHALPRIPPADARQHLEWMRAFARECGDPKIREDLQHTLSGQKAAGAFLRALRKYPRLNEQWEIYYRKQALHYAAVWLKELPVQWEIVEVSRK
jgi:hypothetical protein